ncbi:unnamed protein product [Auanema sp. JU1783]|nr:unnamed protein product [Auanema sp. JU1783]
MTTSDILIKIASLETQLAHTTDKVKMRENVIEQLEEEIKAKERLIYEQSHLISILESDTSDSKFDAESMSSDNEITIIENVRFSPTTSKCRLSPHNDEYGYRDRLEQALVDRERLELQNEQLLKQWEDALEYVSKVQKQLQDELRRNSQLKCENLELQKSSNDCITISWSSLQLIVVISTIIAYYLYSI